jgi:hypothetical protein
MFMHGCLAASGHSELLIGPVCHGQVRDFARGTHPRHDWGHPTHVAVSATIDSYFLNLHFPLFPLFALASFFYPNYSLCHIKAA